MTSDDPLLQRRTESSAQAPTPLLQNDQNHKLNYRNLEIQWAKSEGENRDVDSLLRRCPPLPLLPGGIYHELRPACPLRVLSRSGACRCSSHASGHVSILCTPALGREAAAMQEVDDDDDDEDSWAKHWRSWIPQADASHLTLLGFAINWRNCSPVPTQCIMYLDSSSMSRVTPGQTVTALSVMRLLGMMSAGHVVVPLGLLHMRKLQRWFSRLRLDPIRQKMRLVTLPSSVQSDLTHWGNPRVLAAGVPLGRVTSHVSVFTDASLFGWGGMCQAQVIGGKWPEPPTHHINFLKLSTVLKVLHHFAPLLSV
ncbi:hypothetical protein F2P81_024765 [Scophthalmus maximus]|uniref:Uncharacterized protein n=1 Tax=Scophthalmus maximus TaxID=52904 RepID=A0A6A4RWD0_SCOMX|nr:hypothetical protein F2P81_024765 [Scophthalmus maximus]